MAKTSDFMILENPDFIADKFKSEFITLGQLVERRRRGVISCDYYRQRATCSWGNDQINKMLSWVCNGMPLPQIYICEKKVNGYKYSYIIDGNHRVRNLEMFINNQVVVRKNGAEHPLVTYKDYLVDDNGNMILDQFGSAKFELKQFNIIGKKFSEYPEDLKDRIIGYNIGVTTFLDCTDDDIAYYMRNYNNHTQMNSVDKAMTDISESKVIKLKNLSRHDFLKDKTNITVKSLNAGGAVRICMETIMASYYLENWKSFKKNMEFFDKNVTDYQISTLEREMDRLYEVTGEDDRKLFKSSIAFLYLTLFHRFTNYEIDDDKFIDFLHMFDEKLHSKHIDGDSFDELVKLGGTKGKGVIERKLRILTDLMEEYLGVAEDYNDEYIENKDTVKIKEAIDSTDDVNNKEINNNLKEVVDKYTDYLLSSSYYDHISEGNYSYSDCYRIAHDIITFTNCNDESALEFYTDLLDECFNDIDMGYDELQNINNTPALIAMMKYFDDNNINIEDVKKWFKNFSIEFSSNPSKYARKNSNYLFVEFKHSWETFKEVKTIMGVA